MYVRVHSAGSCLHRDSRRRAAADRSSDARQVVVGGGQRVDLTSAPHRWVSSTSILGRKRVWERLGEARDGARQTRGTRPRLCILTAAGWLLLAPRLALPSRASRMLVRLGGRVDRCDHVCACVHTPALQADGRPAAAARGPGAVPTAAAAGPQTALVRFASHRIASHRFAPHRISRRIVSRAIASRRCCSCCSSPSSSSSSSSSSSRRVAPEEVRFFSMFLSFDLPRQA